MDFKVIVREQREELESMERSEGFVEREGLEHAEKFLQHPNILVVTGVRRCGKSVYSYLLVKGKKTGYVNFDDERLAGLRSEDLNRLLESFYELYGEVEYVILDEVQNVENWQLFANRLRRTKKVILTGSNSTLLSGELSTHLTGRYIDIRLYPFSFREFLKKKGFALQNTYTTKEKASLLLLLREYLEIGGFPEAQKFGKAIVARIYDDIITKDILLRHKITKTEELKKFARYLVTNASQETTYSSLARAVGIKHIATASKWAGYLEDAFLINRVEKFDYKLKQQYISPKKVYCADTGIITSIGFSFSENIGRIMENAVFLELSRRKTPENAPDIYYWKDASQKEVDFAIKTGKKITQLIQVTYANDREEIKERENKSLIKGSDALRCDNLLVITWDYAGEETMDGKKIKYEPMWKWLLEKG